ncbi:peptidoglycan-binding domain-containing protein [Streptomyces purpurascens]|uniref:Peptidoglycan-binding protein n=1 Tax=Streptomyces purpurascens TaxID=1924 RepID=A0ABZ1MQH9_STREF|nr:peptidoglycan-binding domain-containing protein [Streptomyces purpurascens]MCE7045448.1 peptidoglycan-binding protein [Streptomyces purpurascens]GHA06535.1 hypothetical protein GCM10010303_15230 [Streptomyces purpurascens]
MKKFRRSRVTAGAVASLTLLSGLGLGVATAAPASAYAGYCNDGYATVTKTFGGVAYKAYLPGYNGNKDCTMGPNATSGSVALLQSSLNTCYNRSLDPDGIYGPKTTSAVKYAQGKEGISADGIYGSQTRTHLKWEFIRTSGSYDYKCVRL